MDFDRLVFPPPIAALVIGMFHALLHALMPLVGGWALRRGSGCVGGGAAGGGAEEDARSRRSRQASGRHAVPAVPCAACLAGTARATRRLLLTPRTPRLLPFLPPLPPRPGRLPCWVAASWAMCSTTPRTGRCTAAGEHRGHGGGNGQSQLWGLACLGSPGGRRRAASALALLPAALVSSHKGFTKPRGAPGAQLLHARPFAG